MLSEGFLKCIIRKMIVIAFNSRKFLERCEEVFIW